MNRPPATPLRWSRVLVVALALVAAGGCAGSTTAATTSTPLPTTDAAAPPASGAPAPGSGDRGSVGASPTTPDPGPASDAPALDAAGCAAATELYADLVAVPLGLDDDPDPADRAAVAADTTRLRHLVPAPIAHDLDVVAGAYGAQARALDPARAGADLDQAEAGLAAPAVRAALADLDHRLQGCG